MVCNFQEIVTVWGCFKFSGDCETSLTSNIINWKGYFGLDGRDEIISIFNLQL